MLKIILISILALSCSSYHSQNLVTHSNVPFRGGVEKDKKWDEALVFKRTSWFIGATLTYDILLVNMKESSAFVNWFSNYEKEHFNKCSRFYVAMIYSHNLESHSVGYMRETLKEKGLSEVYILEFKNKIQSHPAFTGWNLHYHKVMGLCMDKNKLSSYPITMDLPNFPTATIIPD